jgi:hypothetical protein
MFRLIFLFTIILILLHVILELVYHFPIIVLDAVVLCFGIYFYLLLKKLKGEGNKLYYRSLILTGLFISILNFLPIKIQENELQNFITTKSVMRTLVEYKPHALRIESRKVKTLNEFANVSKIYFKIFFLKWFFIVFVLGIFALQLQSVLFEGNRKNLPQLTC